MINKVFIALSISILCNLQLTAKDTILIDSYINEINIINKCYIYSSSEDLLINDIYLNRYSQFYKNKEKELNYGMGNSYFWTNFIIKNESDQLLEYILEIANPDIDQVDFYEFVNNIKTKEVNTGELKDVSSREYYHRFFIFKLLLKPGVTYNYFIKTYNKGDSNNLNQRITKTDLFQKIDNFNEIIIWLLQGLLLFIFVFNFYLYRASKDKISIFYGLYILSISIFVLEFDGYLFYINIPSITSYIKIIPPVLAAIFMVAFSQQFLDSKTRWPFVNRIFNIFKAILLILIIFYFFNYPINVITIIAVPLIFIIVCCLIIFLSIISLNKKYLPSFIFLSGFLFISFGLLINIFKDLGILPSSFFIDNSIRIGLAFESILLTIAVLERFRLQQENAKKTIENNYNEINTQKKELQKAYNTLEETNVTLERLSIAASRTHNSIAIYDTKGYMEWCNEVFKKINKVDWEKLGRRHKNIRVVINHPKIDELVDRCLNNKEVVIFENYLPDTSEGEMWVQTTLTPDVNENGNVTKIIGIDSNISELKEYEKKLKDSRDRAEQSDKLKSSFLSNMSHEIRTPLNAILGFSSLMTNKNKTMEQKEKFLEIINNNTNHLLKIINDLLNISKIESGDIVIESFEGDIYKLCSEIYQYFRIKYIEEEHKPIEFIFNPQLEDADNRIILDFNKFRQVLNNIIINAFKFTDKGTIEFGYYKDDFDLIYYVKDTGIGIPEEKIDMIFDRFNQAELGLSRRYGGIGLGLSIASGFVNKMGGRIWLESTEGQGTTVFIALPYFKAVPKETSEFKIYKNKDYNWKGKSILIVEDMMESYMYLEEIISPTQAQILHAKTGEEGVFMAQENNIDVVLMDIRLPDISGYEATKRIKKMKKEVQVIAQTANVNQSEHEQCLRAGCSDYIAKPINQSMLLEMIDKQLNFDKLA